MWDPAARSPPWNHPSGTQRARNFVLLTAECSIGDAPQISVRAPRRWILGLALTAGLLGTASGGASAASVKVVGCRTTFGTSQPIRKLPASVNTKLGHAAVSGLEFYANNALLVLAPRDWNCSAAIGADGSDSMNIKHEDEAVTVQAVPYTSGVGASEACSLFSDARPPAPCDQHPPRGERDIRLNATTVAFEDPVGVRGTGDPSGGPLPANGVMLFNPSPAHGYFYQETCVLPAARHQECSVALNEAIHETPRQSKEGP